VLILEQWSVFRRLNDSLKATMLTVTLVGGLLATAMSIRGGKHIATDSRLQRLEALVRWAARLPRSEIAATIYTCAGV